MYSHCTTKCQYAVRVTPVSIPILNDAVSEEGGESGEDTQRVICSTCELNWCPSIHCYS